MLILEAYLDLFLAVCINLYKFKGTWTTWDNILNNILVIIIGLQLVILPIFILAYICPNSRKLKRKRFMKKYGSIYDMIDLRHKQASALLWCIFFIGRRITFTIGVIFFKSTPVFQILIFIVTTLAVLMMVGLAKPLPTPFENKQELYNNFSILVLSYCLLTFTPYVPNPDTKYLMGYIMIMLTM